MSVDLVPETRSGIEPYGALADRRGTAMVNEGESYRLHWLGVRASFSRRIKLRGIHGGVRRGKREIVHHGRNIAQAWKTVLGYAFVKQMGKFSKFTLSHTWIFRVGWV